jgi:hypothetical protein
MDDNRTDSPGQGSRRPALDTYADRVAAAETVIANNGW